MKTIKPSLTLTLLICITVFCFSCENSTEPEGYYSKYYGSWQWTKTTGGFAGGTRYPEEGTSVKISYDAFYRFRLYRNDTLKVSANYSITPDTRYGEKIDYTNIELYGYSYFDDDVYPEFSNEELILWDGAMDGFFHHYKKVNK